MPPAAGFEAVMYKRNLPLRGPSGLAILGGVTAMCANGFYRVGKGNSEKRYVRPKGSANVRTVPVCGTENVSSDLSSPTGNVALNGIRSRDALEDWIVLTIGL
jgi:GRIM-19 protein